MDLSPEERQALDDLREVARRYCAEIEAVSQRTAIEFLRRMNQLLPELYWRASLLHEVDPWTDDDAELDIAPMLDAAQENDVDEVRQETLTISQSLSDVLGLLDSYQSVVDPLSVRSAGEGWMSNDLADIYLDLRHELNHDTGSGERESERYWHWHFEFVHHWGVFHLPPALHAISWLVHQHWDDDDETWDDEFLSRRNPGQT
jgi:hypothetical protein